MSLHYTAERNHQILIALMKEHGVRLVIASPGGTDIGVIQSLQQDGFFTLYSCVDERSAGYMACGLAEETGEAVAVVCTGATAARNYIPALTEAYYRKLPILAITCTRPVEQIGHNIPQVTDRTRPLNDIVMESVYLPVATTPELEWGCEVDANKALLALSRHGGGPAHVNLATVYSEDFSVEQLPAVRAIHRYEHGDELPSLQRGNVGIYVGAHSRWSEELTGAVDRFCELYDAVVLADPTSNYRGSHGIRMNLVAHQQAHNLVFDHLIHIGNNSGAYNNIKGVKTWRVNPDGELRDTFRTLEAIFEMGELEFFERMCEAAAGWSLGTPTADGLKADQERIAGKANALQAGLPFSNPWIALNTLPRIPEGSSLHLAILNSLRSWSYPELPLGVDCYSNTGGFGIDGCTSSLIGASLACPSKLYFGITGDLAMFYDLNSLGSRHIGPNVRIMVVNNGLGTEFKLKQTLSIRAGMGEDTNSYVAAAGHFGNKSRDFLRHIAVDLGFDYLCASSKEEFLENVDAFVDPGIGDAPILFEVFTDDADETEAIDAMKHIEVSTKAKAKSVAKTILGENGFAKLKRIVKP